VFSAIIFDFNGVLVDDEVVHLAAFRDVLGPLGVELSDEAYTSRYLGYDDRGAFQAILTDAGRPPTAAEVDALIEAKRPHYRTRAERELVVFEGASALVARASTWGPVVIVSGALRDEIELALGKMGVRVGLVISAEDTARCKPDPEGYHLAVRALSERFGLSKEKARFALVIEDSLAGIEAAKAAGLTVLAVAHSYPESELTRAGADHVVARIGDVDDALLERMSARAK
jgi:beta-phosphoglucomutase